MQNLYRICLLFDNLFVTKGLLEYELKLPFIACAKSKAQFMYIQDIGRYIHRSFVKNFAFRTQGVPGTSLSCVCFVAFTAFLQEADVSKRDTVQWPGLDLYEETYFDVIDFQMLLLYINYTWSHNVCRLPIYRGHHVHACNVVKKNDMVLLLLLPTILNVNYKLWQWSLLFQSLVLLIRRVKFSHWQQRHARVRGYIFLCDVHFVMMLLAQKLLCVKKEPTPDPWPTDTPRARVKEHSDFNSLENTSTVPMNQHLGVSVDIIVTNTCTVYDVKLFGDASFNHRKKVAHGAKCTYLGCEHPCMLEIRAYGLLSLKLPPRKKSMSEKCSW